MYIYYNCKIIIAILNNNFVMLGIYFSCVLYCDGNVLASFAVRPNLVALAI